jgi:hypothetical protein
MTGLFMNSLFKVVESVMSLWRVAWLTSMQNEDAWKVFNKLLSQNVVT